MSDCWPEQEAIEKWFDEYVRGKYGIHHSNQNLMELKEAVTKPRLDLREQLEQATEDKVTIFDNYNELFGHYQELQKKLEQKDKEIEQITNHGITLAESECNLKARNEKLERVVKLVVDDLRMRADDDGVVNISDFIWQDLNQLNELKE